jgi:hypothetical protein
MVWIKSHDVKYPSFVRKLRNLDNNKTKAHKFMKRVSKTYERTGDERDKTEFDAAFKSLQRMKYDLGPLHERD